MLVLRDVQKSDLPGLQRLARVLNTVNLPDNAEVLRSIVDVSVRSFSGRIADPLAREYLFVLEDPRTGALLGTSLVIAQHGTYESPHIYYEVGQREHYSASLGRHFRHTVLSIGYNYEGPTEIGGLVVDPPYRATPDKPGKQLSFVRFLYMAMHRADFRPRVLAELMPPLLPDGRSLLWEACGRKFTGLSYMEADRLSRQNKEFIKELFPASDVYASLFPARTQRVLGEVGPQHQGRAEDARARGLPVRRAHRPVRRRAALRGGPRRHPAGAALPHRGAGEGGLRRGGRRAGRGPG
jgi:arginine N-succinyltransferase